MSRNKILESIGAGIGFLRSRNRILIFLMSKKMIFILEEQEQNP
jgi:hypothetical protein